MNEQLPAHASIQLIISLALPAGAALIFAVLVLVLPVDPMAHEVSALFLGGAAAAGIGGPLVGKALRVRIPAATDVAVYLRQALLPAIVSLVIRELGVLLAAFYIVFGGAFWHGLGVASVIMLSMLLDVRTPGRLRSEYEAHRQRRT